MNAPAPELTPDPGVTVEQLHTLSQADRMRRAATWLRWSTAEATSEPWCFHGGELWHADAQQLRDYERDAALDDGTDSTAAPVWPGDAGEPCEPLFAGDVVRSADARLIAVLRHVGTPLATVLERHADRVEALEVLRSARERALLDLADTILRRAAA